MGDGEAAVRGLSNDGSDAGRDEPQVYSELKLPIGKPLEDAQSQPRAEQSGGDENQRLPSLSGGDGPSAGAMLLLALGLFFRKVGLFLRCSRGPGDPSAISLFRRP